MARNLQREVRANWALSVVLTVSWFAMLIFSPEETAKLAALGVLTALTIALTVRHGRQVSRGETPFGLTDRQLRPIAFGLAAVALASLLIVFALGGGGNSLVLLGPFLAIGVVALAANYWLRK